MGVLMLGTLFMGNHVMAKAKSDSQALQEIDIKKDNTVEMENSKHNHLQYSRAWTKLAWFIAKKVGDGLFQREPTRELGENWDTISSGTIGFNKGDYGGSTHHTIDLQENDHEIDTWPQTNPLNWATKINVIITDPNNRDVKTRSVTHDQHTYYKGGTLGTYTVRYAQQKKQNWDIWLRLFHWTGPCVTPPCPESVDSSSSKVQPMISETTIITHAHTNKKYEAMQTDKGIYIIPSDAHMKKIIFIKKTHLTPLNHYKH